MLQLRKLLMMRHTWFETFLESLARLDGYGDLPRPLVQLCALIGRDPIRIGDLAVTLGTSRQWVTRLAHDGVARDILALLPDPNDRRAMMVGFSESGWRVVRKAVVRMHDIETTLQDRLGTDVVAQLADILGRDWGSPQLDDRSTSPQTRSRCTMKIAVREIV
jgi:DNA-binding MarR family transcriptional regulator